MRRRAPKDNEVKQAHDVRIHSPWKEKHILLGCIAFRLLNALVIQTFFNPDEYWQTTEVAHRIVFGYGHLTWEWANGIRSYIHPLIFAALYKFLELIHMDTRWLVMKAPRLLQALIAAAGDIFVFRLARNYWGEQTARWTIFCQLCNWFMFFCMVRTYSNCIETVLFLAALNYWNEPKSTPLSTYTSRQLALFLAALACAVRPTSAVIWIYIGLIELYQTPKKFQLLIDVFCIGVFTLSINCLLDRWMYGKWILVPLNFFKFNFLSSGGDYYGTHPWHWYFSQGFPAICFTFLPLSILGMYWSRQWKIAGLIFWVLSVYSVLGHKEFRFILPMLPLGLMFAGYALSSMQQYKPVRNMQHNRKTKYGKSRSWLFTVVIALLATNIPMALYMSLLHQSGSEAVMDYLYKEIRDGHANNVTFLMPCHNTPYYSFLHVNITMRFLDCTPSNEVGYVDESDRFLAAPEVFLIELLKDQQKLPTHVVFFDSLERKLQPLLQEYGYKQTAKIFHAHFAVDHGLQKYILVYRNDRKSE